MKAKLVVVGGDAKAAEIALKLPMVIGRGRGSKLVLPHPLVSRRHCEIYQSDGQLMVRDLGSLNGTFVGNERIEECGETVLPPGELLTIGAVTFRAVYGEENGQAESLINAAKRTPAPGAKTVRASQSGTVRAGGDGQGAASIDTEGGEMDESLAADEVEFAEFDNAELDANEGEYDVDSTEFLDLDNKSEIDESDEATPAAEPPRQPPPIAPPRAAGDPPATDADDNELSSFLDGLK